MKENEYATIYESVNASNIKSLSKRFGVHEKILAIILNQKIVRNVRQRSTDIKKNSYKIKERWERGETISAIAKKLDYPPALVSSILLKELGFSEQGKKRAFRDPLVVGDTRLSSEVAAALNADKIYSPAAHETQIVRGKLGESILSAWLTEKKIGFKPEGSSRQPNTKTPDFLLDEELIINDYSIRWIESKASFGDAELHKYYIEKQFASCLDMFGNGMVVYWYGYLENIKEIEPRIFVTDFKFFTSADINRLFE